MPNQQHIAAQTALAARAVAFAPNFIVNRETGEIISPNEFLPGVAAGMGGMAAPGLDDIRHPADIGLVKALVRKNKRLALA